VLVGIVTMLVIGAGCGGGDDDSVTKAEYAKKAEAICAQGLKQLEDDYFDALSREQKAGKAEGASPDGPTPDEILLGYYETKMNQLAGLTSPSAEEEQVEAMLAALETVVEEGQKDPKVFAEETDSLKRERKIAGELGLEKCAQL
jgi:hypothetical protein